MEYTKDQMLRDIRLLKRIVDDMGPIVDKEKRSSYVNGVITGFSLGCIFFGIVMWVF